MSARRFFLEGVRARGESVEIHGSDAHKIVNVLRLRTGDAITAIDSGGTVFEASLSVEGGRVHVVLGAIETTAPIPSLRIDVAQGLPKAQKMDFIIEKLTELGVRTIWPLASERAIARDVGDAKLSRWERLAKSAAQQSGRTDVPTVAKPIALPELIQHFDEYDCVLIPWEAAPQDALRDRLPALLSGVERLLIVIGPEGGFSHGEIEKATAGGAHPISLGSRILRTETAALALVAVVNYATSG